jgi:hypothetical protein
MFAPDPPSAIRVVPASLTRHSTAPTSTMDPALASAPGADASPQTHPNWLDAVM